LVFCYRIRNYHAEPLIELKHLIRTGRLPRVVSIWGIISAVGDCHLLAHALMLDLAAAGPLRHHWQWIVADCRRYGLGRHSWAEATAEGADAFACDLSNGVRRAAIMMPAPAFHLMRGASDLRVMAAVGARSAARSPLTPTPPPRSTG
jgi:hypothetical protein